MPALLAGLCRARSRGVLHQVEMTWGRRKGIFYEAPPTSMKFRQFHEGMSSSMKSMKLGNGNHDSFVLPRLRERSVGLRGGVEMMTTSSSSTAVVICSSYSSSPISMKSSSARPSSNASAPSWLARHSWEVIE